MWHKLQAVYSPLQGTQSIAAQQASNAAQAISAGEGLPMAMSGAAVETGDLKRAPASTIISEMENLAIDTHQQWLEAFVFAPVPALIVSCTGVSNGDAVHEILQANSSAVMVLGRDAASLKAQTLEQVITDLAALDAPIPGQGTGTGLAFGMEHCSVQTVHRPIQASLILIPISDVCTIGQPSCYLVLILDEQNAAQLALSVISAIPSIEEVSTGVDRTKARKGMFCSGPAAHATQTTSGSNHEGYCQADSLNVAHSEAAQRLLEGKCPQCILPPPFDVAAWITKFTTLLTVPADI